MQDGNEAGGRAVGADLSEAELADELVHLRYYAEKHHGGMLSERTATAMQIGHVETGIKVKGVPFVAALGAMAMAGQTRRGVAHALVRLIVGEIGSRANLGHSALEVEKLQLTIARKSVARVGFAEDIAAVELSEAQREEANKAIVFRYYDKAVSAGRVPGLPERIGSINQATARDAATALRGAAEVSKVEGVPADRVVALRELTDICFFFLKDAVMLGDHTTS